MPTKVSTNCPGAKSGCKGACSLKTGCPYGNLKPGDKHNNYQPMVRKQSVCDQKCKKDHPHMAPCNKACMKATQTKHGYIHRS
jgi:hypothetical protein